MNLPDQNSDLEEFRDFSDIDYIVTDLDQTLIQYGEAVWKQLRGIQAKLYNYSLTITIATGRTYYGMKKIADDIRMKKHTPIILYNGAVVISYLTQRILYMKTIPNLVLFDLCRILDLETQSILAYYLQFNKEQKIIEFVHGFGLPSSNFDSNGMRIIWHDKQDVINFGSDSGSFSIRQLVDDSCGCNDEISLFQPILEPCSILIDRLSVSSKQEELLQYLQSSPLVSYTESGSGYLEIKAFGVHKGTIYNYIRGSKNEKCLAIGDNDNDVELLLGADIGVAVANASSAAETVAKYHCHQAGTNGVLELLEVIRTANRYWERKYK